MNRRNFLTTLLGLAAAPHVVPKVLATEPVKCVIKYTVGRYKMESVTYPFYHRPMIVCVSDGYLKVLDEALAKNPNLIKDFQSAMRPSKRGTTL